ncbi:rRNA pseudouridine synthase [Candidatus Woesearchaeota archaeon]|nr:MAG: rRNA pseudouridine synthase [Candidatus Woesearchaeota archaeon]
MEIRVQAIIAHSGYCSRRKAEELIEKGKVKVNDQIIKLGDKAKVTDTITIDEMPISQEKKVWIMLNKPKGYECTSGNVKKRAIDLVQIPERIYTVGRLDKDATGLVLLTNDGDFANKIMHPSKEIPKYYWLLLDREFHDKEKMEKGVRLVDGKVFPKVVSIDKHKIVIKIVEGRKHIVKRMLFKLKYFVKALKRIQIGNLKLDVKEGKWRYLTQKEINQLVQ